MEPFDYTSVLWIPMSSVEIWYSVTLVLIFGDRLVQEEACSVPRNHCDTSESCLGSRWRTEEQVVLIYEKLKSTVIDQNDD